VQRKSLAVAISQSALLKIWHGNLGKIWIWQGSCQWKEFGNLWLRWLYLGHPFWAICWDVEQVFVICQLLDWTNDPLWLSSTF